MEISSEACGFSSFKIDYSDYPKSLISRINEFWVFSIKYRYLLKKKTRKLHLSRLICCNYTCYCVIMLSVKSALRYRPRYQSRSSMYIRGPIPRNFAELAEAVPIGRHLRTRVTPCFVPLTLCMLCIFHDLFCRLLTLFSKLTYSLNSLSNTIRESKGLVPDHDRPYVGPNLGPNGLQS